MIWKPDREETPEERDPGYWRRLGNAFGVGAGAGMLRVAEAAKAPSGPSRRDGDDREPPRGKSRWLGWAALVAAAIVLRLLSLN